MKRVFALGLPLSLLTIALGTSWTQESIAQAPLSQSASAETLSTKSTRHKLIVQPIATQPALSHKQSTQSTEPIGQRIRYTGPFTNTSVNLSGDVVIELVLEENNRISGYINFTNYPDVPSLCGAGDFTGYRQGRDLQFSFVSNDPEPDCGFDRGWFFTVTATLSENYQTLENGAYQIDDSGGVFRAVANNLPVAQTLSTPSTNSVILDSQGTIDRNSQVLSSDGSRYNEYTFQGQSGQEVTITMQSREFDTYLIFLDPSGNTIAQNDDISSTNTNSEITVTLPQSGTYTVVANAYDSRGRGNYSLVVQSLSSESPAIATTPLERSQSVPQPSSPSPDLPPPTPSPSASPPSPLSEEARPGFQRYVVPGMYSIEIPIGWVIWASNNASGYLSFANESLSPNSNASINIIKTEVYILNGSFEATVDQLSNTRSTQITRRGSLLVSGRDALRFWGIYSSGHISNSIDTYIRYTDTKTVLVVSYFEVVNTSNVETIQDIHWSFRVIE